MGPILEASKPVLPPTELTPRIEKAVSNAKSAAERARPAVTEDALTDTYRRISQDRLPDTLNTKLQLSVDDATGEVIGTIVDRDSGDVVKQIPSEEMLKLIAIAKQIFGAIVNETV